MAAHRPFWFSPLTLCAESDRTNGFSEGQKSCAFRTLMRRVANDRRWDFAVVCLRGKFALRVQIRLDLHLLVFFAAAENFPRAVIPDRGISQKSVRSFAAQTMNREDAGLFCPSLASAQLMLPTQSRPPTTDSKAVVRLVIPAI